MSYNQQQVRRLSADTIAAAIALPLRADEFIFIQETGLSYQCNNTAGEIALSNGLFLQSTVHSIVGGVLAPLYDDTATYAIDAPVLFDDAYYICNTAITTGETFDPTKWDGISLEDLHSRIQAVESVGEEVIALRGDPRYANYSNASTYALDARVWEPTSAREYVCIDPVITPEAFNTARWEELSVANNANPAIIRNRLETLTGTARLDASAIQNLPTPNQSMQAIIRDVVARDSVAANATFTDDQTIEMFSRALGFPVTLGTGSGRVNPRFGSGVPRSLYQSGGTDPTDETNAFVEIVFPANTGGASLLEFSMGNAGGSGSKRMWVFNGDPTVSGTELVPVTGNNITFSGATNSIAYDLKGATGEIHILFSTVSLFETAINTSTLYRTGEITRNTLSQAVVELEEQYNMGNTASPNHEVWNEAVSYLQLGAFWRDNSNRGVPRVLITGEQRGFYTTQDNQDETTGTSTAPELIIPNFNLTHDMVLDIRFVEGFSGATDRDIVVYAGDPASGGSRLTPIVGSETATGVYSRAVWNVSPTPEATDLVDDDLHIVFKRVAATAITIEHTQPVLANDPGVLERVELRGGARPAEHSATQAYSAGDAVYRTADNRTFIARDDLTAGPWVAANWYEASTLSNAALVLETSSGITAAHEQLRGEAVSAAFDNTATYAIDDSCVFGNRLYHATSAVLPGAFDPSEWQAISIVDNEGRIDTAEVDIVSLRGADRPADFDATAPYTAGTYVIYLSRLYKARTGVAAGAWDVADWQIVSVITNENRIELVEEDIVSLRGAAAYNAFNIANPYAVGDYVSHLGRDYVAIANVVAGAFDADEWEELSLQAINNRLGFTPLELIADIESVSAADRLESWAVQNVFSKYAHHAKTIADRDAIADDEALSVAQSTEILRTFGVGVTTARNALAYYDDADSWGVYAPSGGQDPTDGTHTYSEVIFTGKDLTGGSYITFFVSDVVSGQTRELRVYNGDATASGTEILPIIGTNSGATAHAVTYQVPANSGDIYVYLGRQVLLDVEFHSTLGSATAEQIRDELETLTGDERLDASAIQGLNVDGTGPFQTVFSEIATRDSIGSGTTMSKAQGDELLARTLVPGAAWRDTNSRIMPIATLSNNSWWFWLNSSVDETADGAAAEFIIPAEEARGKALQARFIRSSSAGTRHFRVYRGDPTSGGTLITPALGQEQNVYARLVTTVWDLDGPVGALDDIHVVVQREGVYDLQMVGNTPFNADKIRNADFGAAALEIFTQYGVTHGVALNRLADEMVSGLGLGAEFRTDAGRVYPVGSGNGAGFFSNAFGDETAASATVCELVIPAGALAHNMVLEVTYGQVTGGGTERDVRVYEGNPVGGGATKLDPVSGTEAHGATDTTYWNVSSTPDSGNVVTNDLHIVFSRVVVLNIKFHTSIPVGGDTGVEIRDKLEALTGTARLNVSAIENASTSIVEVVQTNHPYTQQQLVARGSGTDWSLADTATMIPATGFISEIVDIGTYRVQSQGLCTVTAHGYTTGEYYWLSTGGTFTATQPTSGLIQQVFQVIDADTLLISIGQAYAI